MNQQTQPRFAVGGYPLSPVHQSWQRRRMIEYRSGRPTPRAAGMAGLAQAPGPGQTIAIAAPSITGATIASLAAAKVGWATAAIPIVGPIIAGVTIGLMALFARRGPKQKVATTQIVDAVEPYLQQNVDAYLAGPRTVSAQAQAIANFEAGWKYVIDGCGIPEMGDPGQRCISERQRGGRWDWFVLYLDPIASDTTVQPDSQFLFDTGGQGFLSDAFSSPNNSLLLVGAAVILGAMFFLGGRK